MRVVSQDQGAASQPEESWLGSVRDRRHASAEGFVAGALARRRMQVSKIQVSLTSK